MAPYIYRQTALGETLQESLNELYSSGLVSKELGDRVMLIFDKCMESALANRSNNRVEFKADKLVAYRAVDNVWTMVLEGIEFKGVPALRGQRNERVKLIARQSDHPGKNMGKR